MKKCKKLLKGGSIIIKGEDIVDIVHHTPNMSKENYNKLKKAYEKNKGGRLKLYSFDIKFKY